VAEHAAGVTHRMATVVIAGEEAPDYNTPVYRHGREVGRLLSPSAGARRPSTRMIGMACIESELIEVGTPLELRSRTDARCRRWSTSTRSNDPEKTRPRV